MKATRLPPPSGSARIRSAFYKSEDVMEKAIAAVVVILLCLTGAFAALFQRHPRIEGASPSKTPRWWVAALCSVALVIAVVVFTMYLQP
jgi:hypothetical protein